MNANNGDNSYKVSKTNNISQSLSFHGNILLQGYTTRKGEEDPDTPSSNSYGDLYVLQYVWVTAELYIINNHRMRFKSKANKNVRAKSCTLRELKGKTAHHSL